MRRGYTLIELIITVAIAGILSVGMFKAFEAVTIRSEKAKTLATLSIDSQSALDQISTLLGDRAPMSEKGCDVDGNCEPLAETLYDKKILTWYGAASESQQSGAYSGFVDLDHPHTDRAAKTLHTPGTSQSLMESIHAEKWNRGFDPADLGLMFSGSFEEGDTPEPHRLSAVSDDTITLSDTSGIDTIYEKYYLVDSAYAVTRGEHVDPNAECIKTLKNDLNISEAAFANALLLFYDYRPWNNGNKSFCGDHLNPDPNGKVTLLAANVNAFSAHRIMGPIRLGIDMKRTVRGSNPVRLSKQKVVF